MDKKEVFVFGAGFTKAFFPDAPLLHIDTTDFEGDSEINQILYNLQYVYAIYLAEQARSKNNQVNIENLMTRLSSTMPYDDLSAINEFNVFLDQTKKFFMERIKKINRKSPDEETLNNLRDYCFNNTVDCITFNYDDLFDECLYSKYKIERFDPKAPPYWHPDGGYGFFCRDAPSTIQDIPTSKDNTIIKLLKLHGSINWYIRKGYTENLAPIDALVHVEEWRNNEQITGIPNHNCHEIKIHLRDIPLIIPPTLTKVGMVEQPILSTVWSLARGTLQTAKKITFVGYSMPVTDISAKFLFSETNVDQEITVVNSKKNEPAREDEIMRAYKEVYPNLSKDNFQFIGAVEWAKNLTK